MVTFVIACVVLVGGYFLYSKVVERVFRPDDRKTPAFTKTDGVDFVPVKTWKAVLIQLLNIAGTGPIFGALMGAVFGPIVFLWIVFGSILGGAVHDYYSGMISSRMQGASITEIIGKCLGKGAKYITRIFSVVLLILLTSVFISSPATLMAKLTPDFLTADFWAFVIIIYYLVAVLFPIDKIIGKIYPIFGIILIIMVFGIIGGVFSGGYVLPELTLANLHPENLEVWPFMFVTVACGAISGFHSTQSPMMARCMKTEKSGRKIFYGAMIIEAFIALIWAAAGLAFYSSTGDLSGALAAFGQSGVVYDISTTLLGTVGEILAIIGVVICPITSGDTALRSARLIIADWFKIDQSKIKNRLFIVIPMLAVSVLLTKIDFGIIWRYFSWSNQTLAMITLWSISVYIARNAKSKYFSLMAAIPAAFLSAVSVTYIMMAPEGFSLPSLICYPLGIAFAGICSFFFITRCIVKNKKEAS